MDNVTERNRISEMLLKWCECSVLELLDVGASDDFSRRFLDAGTCLEAMEKEGVIVPGVLRSPVKSYRLAAPIVRRSWSIEGDCLNAAATDRLPQYASRSIDCELCLLDAVNLLFLQPWFDPVDEFAILDAWLGQHDTRSSRILARRNWIGRQFPASALSRVASCCCMD